MLINVTTKSIITELDFRAANPNISFPVNLTDDAISSFGYRNMTYAQPGTYNPSTHKAIEAEPELIGGSWVRGFVIQPLSADELVEVARNNREVLKALRQQQVDSITVTTTAGHTFDGDEESQGRMARAIIALSTGIAPTITWVLANNTTIQATAAELTEALVLAGQAQAAIWVLPG